MLTDAGIFRQVAFRAFRQIESELFDKGFGIRGGLDLNNDRKIVAHGNALIGKKDVVIFFKGHLDRGRALARCDDDNLTGGCDGFAVIVDKGDLNFSIRCDKKFRVRLDRSQNTAAIGSGYFLFVDVVVACLESKGGQDGDGDWQYTCGFHSLVRSGGIAFDGSLSSRSGEMEKNQRGDQKIKESRGDEPADNDNGNGV